MTWTGETGETSCEGSVLNISGGGAAVRGEKLPQVGQTVRLLLCSDSVSVEPVEAQARAISLDAAEKPVVHLRFVQWMPLDALLKDHGERRMWARYPARESRGTLSWLVGSNEKTIPGELLNISGGGAAFVADVQPPPGVPLWLQLDVSARQVDRIDPVESRLVTVSDDPSGMKITHLQFVEPCPMRLFELVVSGSG
jgi:PilZ domain